MANVRSSTGNTEDEQRQDEWGEEEVRLTDEALIGVGATADHARGDGHQQAEEESPAVTHEDARRTEVVREEAHAQADGDDRDEWSEVGRVQQIEVGQLLAVEEEGASTDGDDPGSQPVQAIDEVDRLRHAQQPQHGDERDPVVRQVEDPEERQPEVVHVDAEPDEGEPGDDRPRHLGRGRQSLDVVPQPDDHDDRRRQQHALWFGVAREEAVEVVEGTGDGERYDEAEEHRQATDVGDRRGVHRAVVRLVQPAPPPGKRPDQRCGDERRRARHQTDEDVITGRRHEPPA